LSASASAGVVLCVEKVARHRQQLQRRRSVPLFSGPASLDRNQRFQCTIKNTQCLYYAGSFLGVRLRSRPFVIAKAHVSTTRLSTTAAPCSACYPCRGGAATRLFLSLLPIPVVFRNIVATDAFFGGLSKSRQRRMRSDYSCRLLGLLDQLLRARDERHKRLYFDLPQYCLADVMFSPST
jgi:hypothetical protein